MPSAADFDQAFSVPASPGIRRVWELAEPDLPARSSPSLSSRLACCAMCGRPRSSRRARPSSTWGAGAAVPDCGWPGRQVPCWWGWTSRRSRSVRPGSRAAVFGLAGRARFAVGDLAGTGLPAAAADAVVSIDAFHFAADPAAAAAEARRILRPGQRLVLTNWQPKVPGDSRLPGRARIDWPALLRGAGFTGIEMEARPEWQDTFTRVYQVALGLGDPGMTPCSPTCKTKPGSACRWPACTTGLPSSRPPRLAPRPCGQHRTGP